ncbi:MAG TPA: penicillin-binding protein [Vicinamibacterales bacterium]|nr:penicillin-binding protein [Vicinamibacterales bacterium]
MSLLTRLLNVRVKAIDPFQGADRPDQAFEAGWRPGLKARVVIMLAFTGFWTVGIAARLVQLQVFQHDHYVELAENQQLREVKQDPKRGDIVDRHGRILAYSVDAEAVGVDPTEVEDPAGTIEAVCAALGDCTAKEKAEFIGRLRKGGDGRFMFIRKARQVSPSQSSQVGRLNLPGVMLVGNTRRYYPNTDLAAHVLGFVGDDNTGLGGIESSYDAKIRGRPGRVLIQRDARHQRLQTRVKEAPTAGASLELTLDLYLQHIAERELRAGVLEHRAHGGTAIIMDPHTGEILALANYPTFNPNTFGRSTPENRRNRAVQDLYEPGSTFKIVTASAAIEEGVISPTDSVDCSPGYIKFEGRKPINDEHRYGVLSFEDVIVKSSNVGTIRVGLRLGAERLGRYVRRYGFGEVLTTDFAGENAGIVYKPSELDDSALASMLIGYQIGVTPIQMAAAVSAVANGGLLFEPHVVRAEVRDGVRSPVERKPPRRVITPRTSATLTTIMEGVVDRGTAKAARLERYQIAGKTGTAQKIVDGQYSHTDFNASFVGFVPSRRPVYAIIVVIDTPRAGTFFGGTVAAPIFKRIAEAALQQGGVPPSINRVAPVIVAEGQAAPEPKPSAPVVQVVTDVTGQPLMPDVRGLGARQALKVLGGVGLTVRMTGSGVVSSQSPLPGQPVEAGGWSVLQLHRVMAEPRPPGGER